MLLERIVQERNTSARKRQLRREKEKLEDAIELGKIRAEMIKGS